MDSIKKKLLEMLNECSEILSRYKDLRSKGLAQDKVFEAIFNTRKQTLTELFEMLPK